MISTWIRNYSLVWRRYMIRRMSWVSIRSKWSYWRRLIRTSSGVALIFPLRIRLNCVSWIARSPCYSLLSDSICWKRRTLLTWWSTSRKIFPVCPRPWSLTPLKRLRMPGWKANGYLPCRTRAWCRSCNIPINVSCVRRCSTLISTVVIIIMRTITRKWFVIWLPLVWRKRSWWAMMITLLSCWRIVWRKARIRFINC